jgi:hypothetical protein
MHSFGLYSEIGGKPLHHVVFQSWQPGPVVFLHDETRRLSIDDLFEMFVVTLEKYRSAIPKNHALRERFEVMFPKYGRLFVLLPRQQPRRARGRS